MHHTLERLLAALRAEEAFARDNGGLSNQAIYDEVIAAHDAWREGGKHVS